VHYAAIKYEIKGKVHSIYRRTRGPEKHGVDAWKKGACGQCDGFDPVELITSCWRSKWKSGAPNTLVTDFQMFSNEQDYFDRKGWTFCIYDDCGDTTRVGYPRDCGPTADVPYQWHGFANGNSHGQSDVAFYISVCNGWTAPVIELGDPAGAGWESVYVLVLLGLAYFVGGSALGARRKGQPLKKGPEMLQAHPHYGNWMQLHGLVQDGVSFSRARVNAKLGKKRAAGGAYQRVESSPGDDRDEDGHTVGERSGSRNAKNKNKRNSKEPSKRSKDGKPKREKESRSKTKRKEKRARGETLTAQEAQEEKEEIEEEEKERQLRELADSTGVHSSQAKIKVVGLNG
jgi:hypothetical protein